MSILGVIPAAGKGSRWGGYYKELLPVGNKKWMIDKTITTMFLGGAEDILVVSNKEKIHTHVQHLEKYGFHRLWYTIQREDKDIYGAIYESLSLAGEYNLFAMPDTFIPDNTFVREFTKDFYLGIFKTDKPERFGVLTDSGDVVNKDASLKGVHDAWGTIVWSKEVAEFWKNLDIDTYTTAINLAISTFGLNTFQMDYYFDLATWGDYASLLRRLNGNS